MPLRTAAAAAATAVAASSSAPSSFFSSSLSASDLAALADVAAACADAAAEVTLAYFRSPSLAVDSKADASPVTAADRAAESAVRRVLSARVPSHAVFGEEAGMVPGESGGDGGEPGSEFLWVVDPIDGTKSFITGKPLWGTLVALLHRGEPVLGLIDQPVLRERWLGLKGARTTFNGGEIRTRSCGGRLEDAYLYATTPHMFSSGRVQEAWARVRDEVRIPLYGCDCYAYGLLALGHADLVVEADLGPYDYLAIAPVVAGAGGKMTDWSGGELRANYDSATRTHSVEGLAREVVAAGDAATHAAVLEKLAWK
jgi:inositol-phosphate phosphatase / L-galactose 1-phosphate phosphatase / histidinol-phosphatase